MSMALVRAIVPPKKSGKVMASLVDAGFPAMAKSSVLGQTQQPTLKIADHTHGVPSKELLMVAVPSADTDRVVQTLINAARSEGGAFGDGLVYVGPVDEAYTISTGTQDT